MSIYSNLASSVLLSATAIRKALVEPAILVTLSCPLLSLASDSSSEVRVSVSTALPAPLPHPRQRTRRPAPPAPKAAPRRPPSRRQVARAPRRRRRRRRRRLGAGPTHRGSAGSCGQRPVSPQVLPRRWTRRSLEALLCFFRRSGRSSYVSSAQRELCRTRAAGSYTRFTHWCRYQHKQVCLAQYFLYVIAAFHE